MIEMLIKLIGKITIENIEFDCGIHNESVMHAQKIHSYTFEFRVIYDCIQKTTYASTALDDENFDTEFTIKNIDSFCIYDTNNNPLELPDEEYYKLLGVLKSNLIGETKN